SANVQWPGFWSARAIEAVRASPETRETRIEMWRMVVASFTSPGSPPHVGAAVGASVESASLGHPRERREVRVGEELEAHDVAVQDRDVVLVPQRNHWEISRHERLQLGVDLLPALAVELVAAVLHEPVGGVGAVAGAVLPGVGVGGGRNA